MQYDLFFRKFRTISIREISLCIQNLGKKGIQKPWQNRHKKPRPNRRKKNLSKIDIQ